MRLQVNAKNSFDGLCRQAIAGMPVCCAALAAMAISAAASAFQTAASARAQLCAFDSRFCHRSSRHVANPNRNRDLGPRSSHRFVKLAPTPRLGHGRRYVSTFGLRLLVVALANHMVPIFWRFHNVHHTDLDLDVSTAARFHFGEMIFSIGFLSLAVMIFGIAPLMLVVFFMTFEGATLFHHSNWRLPIKLERILNLIIVTPRMHGIHHSIVQRETNSNWGTIFCWWDKLHRTLRRDVPQDAVTIGVAAYRDEHELTLGKLLALPFRQQRAWRLPDGGIPERAVQSVDELVE